MDARDFRLLAHLRLDPIASYESLGRAVGLSGTAAKERLHRLQEEGVLLGFHGMPSARALGCHPRFLTFGPVEASGRVVKEALASDQVVSATCNHDGSVSLLAYTDDPLALPPQIAEWVDPCAVEDVLVSDPIEPSRSGSVSPIHWRLMAALVDAPRLPVLKLAAVTGLSPRTVRKRRNALFRTGLVTVQPLLQTAHARGVLLFEVQAFLEPGADALAWDTDTLPRCARIASYARPAGVRLLCLARSLAEVVEAEARVKDQPGVRVMHLHFPMQSHVATDRLRAWVHDKLDAGDRTSVEA